MAEALLTSRGENLLLGEELGKGGEGSVFAVPSDPGLVAKIYHQPPPRQKEEKLKAMAAGCTERLRKIAAWPTATLHDPKGRVRGFLMRKVARHKDIHILYGPKTRLRDYPEKTYAFLVHVAANVSRAFAVVHDHGHVIGDVNQGGVCVSSEGLVSLVDCDSFQVGAGGVVYACDVGIPIYQPPEFQSVSSFRGLQRTSNHDCFGLAVLIFQTLFLARHPFAGAYLDDGDMSIEQAIREYRFAYGREAERRRMKQPPGSLGLGSVPPSLALLFERAFLEGGVSNGRPTARDWIDALDHYAGELRECPQNSGHSYWRSLAGCPLCEIEGRIGVLLFVPPRHVSSAAGPAVSLEALWANVVPILDKAAIPPATQLRAPPPSVPPPRVLAEYKAQRAVATNIFLAGAAVSVALLFLLPPLGALGLLLTPILTLVARGSMPPEGRDASACLRGARERVNRLVKQIEAERSGNPLFKLLERAEAGYGQLKGHERLRVDRLRTLEQSRHARQLARFLDQHEVKDCGLKGFGVGLLTTLVSNGVETADDISQLKLAGIPGFGPKRISALLTWRSTLESRFRFNPNDPADAKERSRLEREMSVDYSKRLAEFQKLVAQIKQQAPTLLNRISSSLDELEGARRELAAARAVAEAVGVAG